MKNTSIVTIYDTKNNMAPLDCHRVDAREFLGHKSGRWVSNPDTKSKEANDAKPLETKEDSGKAMQLKETDFKALQAMAAKANIPDYQKMNKAALVAALEAAQ
jgi:hypothetical protein